jgi:hypothetical protein
MPSPIDYEQLLNRDHVEQDSDIHAFAIEQIVSVSPISIDLTARVDLGHLEKMLRK